jgi:hypothetical protein
MRTSQTAETNQIHILLDGGVHYLLGRLMESGVNDLKPAIPERPRYDTGAPVMTVKTGLCYEDSDLSRYGHVSLQMPLRKAHGL